MAKIYNLQEKNDRQEIVKLMLNWSESQLLATHDKMFKEGYKGELSDMDKKMYHFFGKGVYNQMSDGNFTYSCLEAEYLGINLQSKAFVTLCQINRNQMWESAKDILADLSMGKKINSLDIASESEMKAHIRFKWKNKPRSLDDIFKT